MFHRIFQCSVVAAAMLILGPASARATIFSGNPFADGWLAGGRSNHVGPDPGFPNGAFAGAAVDNAGPIAEYQVYSHTTTIIDQSFLDGILAVCGVQCMAWAIGDTIVGLGAVFPNDATGGNQSPATLVVKWGVSASAYTLSSDLLGLNAVRNHEAGEGGAGSVLAELSFAGAGSPTPTAAFQWTGTQNLSLPLAGTFIAFNSIVVGQFFRSFEAYLNVTRLNLANPNGANNPLLQYDGNSIVGVRNYQIGPLFSETNALINGVPEPATGLLTAGALLAGWIVRRRRLNS